MLPNKLVLDQGGALAVIFLQNGNTDIVSIKPIVGRYFKTIYGDFQLNAHMGYIWGKKLVYFYYQSFPNPLDVESIVKIWNNITLPGMNDPTLRKADLDNEATRKDLGETVIQFLNAFEHYDPEALEHSLDVPIRTDKKSPLSTSIPPFPPAPTPAQVGLYVTKDRRIEQVKLAVKRTEKGISGKFKYGELDLSDKRRRYRHGKASLYILFEGEDKPVYMNVNHYLDAFRPYEPITVMDQELALRDTNRTVRQAMKKAEKKPMNIMLVLIGIIAFVVIYQVVLNPMISKAQSQGELDRINQNIANQKQLEIERLEAENEQLKLKAQLNEDSPVIS